MTSLLSYRNFRNRKIPILTIPKGTCLFRYIYSQENPLQDFVGVKNENSETFCLHSNHNVFFYPYPYVFDTNAWVEEDTTIHNPKMFVYSTTRDIKILLLIKPSKYRVNTKTKDDIFVPCKGLQFCKEFEGRSYDICLTEDFIKENPDIVGNIRVVFRDNKNLKTAIQEQKLQDFTKFMSYFFEPTGESGVPEICLYPRKTRLSKELTTSIDTSKGFEWLEKHIDEFNYFPILSFPHTIFEKDMLYTFLEEAFTEKGFLQEKKIYHLAIDKRTYFYIFLEFVEKKDKSSLEKNLSYIRKNHPTLLFDYSRTILLRDKSLRIFQKTV